MVYQEDPRESGAQRVSGVYVYTFEVMLNPDGKTALTYAQNKVTGICYITTTYIAEDLALSSPMAHDHDPLFTPLVHIHVLQAILRRDIRRARSLTADGTT